ncbi:Type VI secretion system baseplate subunit TssE [Rhodovastum atsumiense]|uniref:Type VI secretion system baseplate subunit TssE n=1 Tax=Rhodovastum atsumiense TaxID=504468 RepID=A0A5M6IWN1_9PROT|nr:type VI secretion system baseplate subunit TssE [Rhodovastum atsumiense]KAA5612730.1 type VI secretion system baseplate subunit TssE [Rhodovastum atsumiense]CAH2602713.1 Type VI secretion system baseplate subunit TssE [Rhodovastum atsumiense]
MSATIRLSVLDRLLDERPEQVQEAPVPATEALARLRRAVQRDVEALLNARRPWRSVPPGLTPLLVSPLAYGLPDFTAGAFNDRRQRDRLRAEIEDTLRRFEPRLAELRVTLAEDVAPLRATLMLRIDALLLVDPVPQPVAFDTAIDTTTADIVLNPVHGDA